MRDKIVVYYSMKADMPSNLSKLCGIKNDHAGFEVMWDLTTMTSMVYMNECTSMVYASIGEVKYGLVRCNITTRLSVIREHIGAT